MCCSLTVICCFQHPPITASITSPLPDQASHSPDFVYGSGNGKTKSHPKLSPHMGTCGGPCSSARLFPLTAALGAVPTHSGTAGTPLPVVPALHAASPLLRVGAGNTAGPWLLQDLPLVDVVRHLAGLGTVTPAAPLCPGAWDCWKTRWHLQGQRLWHLGSGPVLPPFPTRRTPHI